jgi:cell division protein FtsW (lipid II flippase)
VKLGSFIFLIFMTLLVAGFLFAFIYYAPEAMHYLLMYSVGVVVVLLSKVGMLYVWWIVLAVLLLFLVFKHVYGASIRKTLEDRILTDDFMKFYNKE